MTAAQRHRSVNPDIHGIVSLGNSWAGYCGYAHLDKSEVNDEMLLFFPAVDINSIGIGSKLSRIGISARLHGDGPSKKPDFQASNPAATLSYCWLSFFNLLILHGSYFFVAIIPIDVVKYPSIASFKCGSDLNGGRSTNPSSTLSPTK